MVNRHSVRIRLVIGTVMILGVLVQPGTAQGQKGTEKGPIPTHMFDSWAQLVDAADVKTLMTLFDDGIVWSSPDPDQVVSGKEALRIHLVGTFAQAKATGSAIKVDHEQVAGSWANVTASFTATWTDSNGKKSTERSRYVCVLKRSQRQWRIWRFTYFPAAP